MKKLFCLLLVLAMAIPAFAQIKVTGHAPTVKGNGADLFNGETQRAFDEAIKELNDQLKIFKNPDKFLQAMGNSSVYGSHGATTRGYAGYKVFSATIGPTFGVQLPASISTIMDDMKGLTDSLEKDGDIGFGINPNFINVNVGLNLGLFKFIPEKIGIAKRDNFYFGFRVGYFNLSNIEGFSFNTLTLGLTVNYQIIPTINLAGLVKWRGVSLGSGFIYNHNKLGFDITVDNIEEKIDNNTSIILEKPRASLYLNTNTFTIPLEAVTAIKLLIFNIPFGIGADIAFGKTSLGAGLAADIDIKGSLPTGISKDKKGDVLVNGELSNSPSVFNFKIMSGFGFHAGPVVFDIPITYYPGIGGASGYNFGITIGAVY